MEKQPKKLEFPKNFQTAVSGIELTVHTENGRMIHWKHISGPIEVSNTRPKRGHRKSETKLHQGTSNVF